MPSLDGRRVVLGVCGGIAAYKAVEVCRRLVDAGAFVSPVMTESATKFVGTATFDALASEAARTSLWNSDGPIPHTSLGQQADLIVVAPATARLIAAYAHGLSHDLLTNVLIATRAPVVICPAMHTEMWEHPAVQENLRILRSRGVIVVDPEPGRLAGGDVGMGRLAEPASIAAAVLSVLNSAGRNGSDSPAGSDGPAGSDSAAGSDGPAERESAGRSAGDFAGLKVLVTAGGTREPIDPVRFIGNRSSGKQGHALANAAERRGAEVTLITTAPIASTSSVTRVQVDTAAEMAESVLALSDGFDVVIMAAAVADFTPVSTSLSKLKKRDGAPPIVLEPTVDILATLGSAPVQGRTLVGFAAETSDVRQNSAEKLASKGVDLLVVNDVSAPGVGFEGDTNEVMLLTPGGLEQNVALTDKDAVADAVLDAVLVLRSAGTEPNPEKGT